MIGGGNRESWGGRMEAFLMDIERIMGSKSPGKEAEKLLSG